MENRLENSEHGILASLFVAEATLTLSIRVIFESMEYMLL